MTDEKYLFKQTELERKRNGRGTFNKVRRGGRYVRMPSDNMTKKERDSMNGEVRSYDFSKPLGWKQFQKMPEDLQQEYLDFLTSKFSGVSNAMIGESMGVKNNVFAPYFYRHGLKVNKTLSMGRKEFLNSESGKKWLEWTQAGIPVVEATEEEAAHGVQSVKEETYVTREEPRVKNVDLQNIAALLQMLSGTGAKMTIEFTL